MKVAIIGGGIAGLATAAGLFRRGFDIQLFEQASQLGEIGAGVNISPNAVKAIHGIGVGAEARAAANVPGGIEVWDMATGEVRHAYRYTTEEYGTDYYQFHRADLVSIFAGGLPASLVHTGHRCVDLTEQPGGQIELQFANGTRYAADLVVAADGVRSEISRILSLAERPVYTGQVAWRTILPGDAIDPSALGGFGCGTWIGPGGHVISYFLRGRSLVNLVVRSESEEWTAEGWSQTASADEMRDIFWDVANPALRSLLGQISQCSKWGLFLRKPADCWRRGRVQLIGDAAHPMLPDAGQGAAQAIEDAYTLTRWLDEHRSDIDAALDGFNRVRVPRAQAVQRQSAENTRIFHAAGATDLALRDSRLMETRAQGDTLMRSNWIFKHDPVARWDETPTVPAGLAA